ncbi:MAG: cupin domain-containing protein, partial [Xanthobacteraceae bacterium]
GLLFAPLLAALPASLLSSPAAAIDPNETQVTLPDQYQWKPALPGAPPRSVETAPLFGATDRPGPYVVVIRWHPGYMSAPHSYVTDRLCFVLSGTWWVNSGETFEPAATVPVPAGGFVRRVAHTPHYDGVKSGEKEPAVIGIFGQAPIEFKLVDPRKPLLRPV